MVKRIVLILIIIGICNFAWAKCEVRFFEVAPNQAGDYKAVILPTGDFLPLAVLSSARVVYSGEYKGKLIKIIRAIIPKKLIKDIATFTDVENPLSIEGVQALRLGSYRGETYTDNEYSGLFYYYPELAGKKEVGKDEEGNPSMAWIVERQRWLCE